MIRDGGIHSSGDDYRRGDEQSLEGDTAPENDYGNAYRRTGPQADGPSTPRIVPATWSNNTDTRTRRAIADGFPANQSTYRRIGQLNDACSGTLIGPRHVLTAAHCLVDNSDQDVFWSVFRPRRNGENNAPWGARNPEWYWFPEEYWDGTCTGSGNCNRYDIALIILAPWEGAHPGWLGYWYVGGGTMETWNIYMRGYPRADPGDGTCWDYPSTPASCTPWVVAQLLPHHAGTVLLIVSPHVDLRNVQVGSDADGWEKEAQERCGVGEGRLPSRSRKLLVFSISQE